MSNKVSFIIQLKDKFSRTAAKVERTFGKMITKAKAATHALKNMDEKGRKHLGNLSKKMAKVGGAMTAGVTLPIILMGKHMVAAASDAVETANKFNEVFDTVKGKANNVANTFAKDFGVARSTARKMIGDTGDLLVGFGFTGDAALEMSADVNRLASDLASFQNFAGGASGASIALTKALLGESESAKALGIVIRQGTPEFKKNIKMIQRTQKVTLLQAKAIEIMRIAQTQSTKAMGDVNRTWEDYASVQRRAQERTKNTMETFGTLMLPLATKVQRGIIKVTDALDSLSPSMKKFVLIFAGFLAIGGPLVLLIGGIVALFATLSLPVLAVSAAVVGLIAVGILLAANWSDMIGGLKAMWTNFSDFLFGVFTSYKNAWKALWEGDFVGFVNNAINIGIAAINRFIEPLDFIFSLMGGDAGTLKIQQLSTAPSAPVGGGSATLNGSIVVAASPGAQVKETSMSTKSSGMNVGMNMVTGQ